MSTRVTSWPPHRATVKEVVDDDSTGRILSGSAVRDPGSGKPHDRGRGLCESERRVPDHGSLITDYVTIYFPHAVRHRRRCHLERAAVRRLLRRLARSAGDRCARAAGSVRDGQAVAGHGPAAAAAVLHLRDPPRSRRRASWHLSSEQAHRRSVRGCCTKSSRARASPVSDRSGSRSSPSIRRRRRGWLPAASGSRRF